jgi:protein O-GlcNAc transferase
VPLPGSPQLMEYAKLIRVSFDLAREVEARDRAKAELRSEAIALAAAGRTPEAEASYRRLLALDARDADAWHALGLLCLGEGRLADAGEALLRALTLDPGRAPYHFDFGSAVRQASPAPPALLAYLQLLGLAETNLAASNVASDELLMRVEALCRAVCTRSPDQPEPYSKLGHILLARGHTAQAVDAYDAAYQLRPDSTSLAENLAAALHRQGEHGRASLLLGHTYYRERRYGEAIQQYQQSLAEQPGTREAHSELAHALNHNSRYEETIETCLAGIRRYPSTPDLYYEMVCALLEVNRTDEATAVAALAAERFPDRVTLAHQRDLALPVLYERTEDITRWHRRFAEGIERVCRETRLDGADAARSALKAIDTHFYLAYQCLADTNLRVQYGQLVHRTLRANYPAYAEPPLMPALTRDGRIRVGYISASIRWPGVAEIFLDWLARKDSVGFETYVYNVAKSEDLVARQFEQVGDHYQWLPRELETVCEQVQADRLHILIFLDVGIDPFMTQLAALRLSPVQCVTSGHPVTTGLPTLDYFISAEFAEPENGQEHYSERLVLLPNIGVCPRRPFPTEQRKTRAQLGIDDDAVVYFSPQSISKYLPQYDDLYPAIAQRVPAAQFLFASYSPQQCINLFRGRLLRAFARHGLEGERHLRFVPPVEYSDYLGLNLIADVFLDSIGWSGGLTTLDALGCALPVVTCPGEFMRGRQSFAFLRQIDVLDTVAASTDEYVEIAVRLGLDAAWRASIRQQIAQRLDRLYDKEERVAGLERFYRQAVRDRLEAAIRP